MRRILFFATAFACLISAVKTDAGKRIKNRSLFDHVVVIGIDGLSSAGLKQAKTPVMDEMIAGGAFKYDARTVLPTVSAPNWAAMLNGAGPEATGISSNKWQIDSMKMLPVEQNLAGWFPGIFNIVREQRPDAEQGAIFHWGGFGKLFQQEMLNRCNTYSSAEETTREVCDYIVSKKPVFAFIQLDHVDAAGHKYGHMTEEYFQSISNADTLVGRIMKSIEQAGMKNNTLVMIVSDHGGIRKGHGGESVEESTVPVIYSGKGVKKNYTVTQVVYMYDVAANVAFALNLKIPYAWTGRATLSAFEN